MRTGTVLWLLVVWLPAGCGSTAYQYLREASPDSCVSALSGPRSACPALLSADDVAAVTPYSDLIQAQVAARHRDVELRCYWRLDRFNWSEYWRKEPEGSRILEETGATHALGVSALLADRSVRLGAELMIGDVDYDGQTWAGTPLRTETEYLGLEADFTYRWELDSRFWDDLHLAVGGNMRSWSRDLKPTSVTVGAVEEWLVMSVEFGVVAGHTTRRGGRFFWEAFLHWPLFTNEDAEILGTTAELEPDGKFRLPAELKVGYGWENGLALSFRLRRMGFDRSELTGTWLGPVYQPASTMTRVGLEVEYSF